MATAITTECINCEACKLPELTLFFNSNRQRVPGETA